MIIGSLLLALAIVLGSLYLVYYPLRSLSFRATQHAKDVITRNLEEMFIFVPVRYIGIVKVFMMCMLAVLFYILSYSIIQPAPYIFAGGGAVLGFYIPEIVVCLLRRRRRKQFADQLLDGLILLSNGLRAGFNFPQALEMLVEESSPPLSQEFELVLNECRVGLDLEKALMNCYERTRDADLEIAVTATAITRQLGGSLPNIFDRLVSMIRSRKLLEGKVGALTAQGRAQAIVVGLLPYVFGFFVTKVNPELMRLMWTTLPGFCFLVLILVLDVVGFVWILRLSKIKY